VQRRPLKQPEDRDRKTRARATILTRRIEQGAARIARESGGSMSERMKFEIVCPNDHDQTVTFSQEEFEQTLKSGALVFHCNTCDTTWPPSHEEIVEIRKGFPKNSG